MGERIFMKEITAVFPGSFDPVTNGHIDIARRAQSVFGRVVVLVIPNAGKQPLFTLEERVELLRETFWDMPGITVQAAAGGLLADFVRAQLPCVIVRGLRGAGDVEHEFTNAHYNALFCPQAETVFFPSRPENMFLSASAVREAYSYGAGLPQYVSPAADKALRKKFSR